MWYLQFKSNVTEEMETREYSSLERARAGYLAHLPEMAYGAIYEANSEQEMELAHDLFVASEQEIERREEEYLDAVLGLGW